LGPHPFQVAKELHPEGHEFSEHDFEFVIELGKFNRFEVVFLENPEDISIEGDDGLHEEVN
jgi:hypothetical protein